VQINIAQIIIRVTVHKMSVDIPAQMTKKRATLSQEAEDGSILNMRILGDEVFLKKWWTE
jgi:hypothetical protein